MEDESCLVRQPAVACGCGGSTGAALLAQQQDPSLVAALTEALQQLMGSNGVQHSMSRENRRKFRGNLRTFLPRARSIVRSM